MEITTTPGLQPNFQRYLKNIEEKYLFHASYGIRHPVGIYNSSFEKMENSLRDFFEVYSKFSIDDFQPGNKEYSRKVANLLKEYRFFLYSLREHLDSCFHVVKTLVPPSSRFNEYRSQYAWIRRYGSREIHNFLDEVEEYRICIAEIVNQLKHNSAILNAIFFYDNDSREFSLGYYVANVVNGRYQPIESIHQKYHGQDTAFSFARDIRFNMYHVFFVSEKLVDLIRDLKIIPQIQEGDGEVNEGKLSLYKNISNLPRYFFPDEELKEVPSVAVLETGILRLAYPSKLSIKAALKQMLLYHSPDGVTREFALLYDRKK